MVRAAKRTQQRIHQGMSFAMGVYTPMFSISYEHCTRGVNTYVAGHPLVSYTSTTLERAADQI